MGSSWLKRESILFQRGFGTILWIIKDPVIYWYQWLCPPPSQTCDIFFDATPYVAFLNTPAMVKGTNHADFKISSLASMHTQISTAHLKRDPLQNRHLIFNGLLLLYIDVCIRSPELSLGLPKMQVILVLSEKHHDNIVVFSGIRKGASK